jgi:hypothetical protein
MGPLDGRSYISTSPMAACKVPTDSPPLVSCVPANEGCICVLHHGSSSSCVARVNGRHTQSGGGGGGRGGGGGGAGGGGCLGKCEDPREVDACIMRVGSWWSIQCNAVLFP